MSRKTRAGESEAGQQAATKKKPFYKRIWFWLVAVVVVIIAVNVAGGDEGGETESAGTDEADSDANEETGEGGTAEDDGDDAAAEDEAVQDEAEEPADDGEADGGETFTIGEEFAVNDWMVTISAVGERTSTVGDEFLNTEAQGEFLPVDLVVTNDGDSAQHFFASDFVAVDGQDREFNYSSDATMYGASDGAVSLLDEINPGNSIEGRLFFDVPADAEVVGLDINAGFLSDPVRVSLN